MRRLVRYTLVSCVRMPFCFLEVDAQAGLGLQWFSIIRTFRFWKTMRSLVWVYAGPICHTAVFYLNGQCEDWSGFTLVPCINFVNKKRYDKICHIWGVTSENRECYAEISCGNITKI